MISVVVADEDERESKARTLGDVLYIDKAKVRVSETDWVGLVQSIAARDQLALHSLFEQTHRIVFTLLVRITGNRETAEELTLDVFHDVWRRASTYDPANGSVVGWIMNLARSRAIKRLRFEHRNKLVGKYVDSPLTSTVSNDPRRAFDLAEQSRKLRNALEGLTPEELRVIETAY